MKASHLFFRRSCRCGEVMPPPTRGLLYLLETLPWVSSHPFDVAEVGIRYLDCRLYSVHDTDQLYKTTKVPETPS